MSPPPLLGPLTRAEALEIIRGQNSRDDLRRIEATPEGRAMLYALIDPFVELSRKLDRSFTARHLLLRESDVNPIAAGAAKASATIAFGRTVVGSALVLPARSAACRVITEEGHRYELEAAVTFAPGEAGPKAQDVESMVAGYASTVIAGRIVAFEEAAHGAEGDKASVEIIAGKTYLVRLSSGDFFYDEMVGLYVAFTEGSNAGKLARIVANADPSGNSRVEIVGDALVAESGTAAWAAKEWAELGLTVTQPADSTQGTDDELDALGRERGRHRQAAEGDATYLAAVSKLSDTVSPAALLRLANRALGVYGPALLYEAGTAAIESDVALGYAPFPGFVWGLTPLGIVPTGISAPVDEPYAPPDGLAALAKSPRYFMIRWDGAGLGEVGGYLKSSTGIAEDDAVPYGFVIGLTPLGGYAIDDEAIRATIYDGIEKIRGGGVRWTFYPRHW